MQIVLDADEISAYAGREVSRGSILVDFVSYVGRADISGNVITVSEALLGLEDVEVASAVG